MVKCFVKKLKESVNADIPVFNGLFIKFFDTVVSDYGRTLNMTLSTSTPVELKVINGNGTFSVDGGAYTSSVSLSNGSHTIIGEGGKNFTICLYGKNTVYGIDVPDGHLGDTKAWGIDVSQLEFNPNLDTLILNGNKTVSIFAPQNDASKRYITRLKGVFVDLDAFDYDKILYTGTPYLTKILPGDSGESCGDIINLKNYTQLNELLTYSPSVTGEIDDLCAAQVAKGRTSGSISFGVVGSSITDDGNVITSSYIRSKGGTSLIVATFSGGTYTKSYT